MGTGGSCDDRKDRWDRPQSKLLGKITHLYRQQLFNINSRKIVQLLSFASSLIDTLTGFGSQINLDMCSCLKMWWITNAACFVSFWRVGRSAIPSGTSFAASQALSSNPTEKERDSKLGMENPKPAIEFPVRETISILREKGG